VTLSLTFGLLTAGVSTRAQTRQARSRSTFDQQPFDISRESLPPNYLGHYFPAIFAAVAKRQAASKKGEYETTSDYENRLARLSRLPLVGSLRTDSLFAFVIGPVSQNYEADGNTLHLSLALTADAQWLHTEKLIGSYVGRNAFNRAVRVKAYRYDDYLLEIEGYSQPDDTFSASITKGPVDAQKIKPHIRALLLCYSLTGASSDSDHDPPTVDEPYDEYRFKYTLNIKPVALWFFDSANGTVLAKVEPGKPETVKKTDATVKERNVAPNIPKLNTGLVSLNIGVTDLNKQPTNNLSRDDFKVYEDGVLQPILSFAADGVPLSWGLAVDNSGSMHPQWQQLMATAKFIINGNKRGDETFLERFISSDKIETVQDFTSNKDMLLDGLDSLNIEGGQTAVIDGIYIAAEHLAVSKKGNDNDHRRRVLIVITDGDDRASFYTESQLFQRLGEADLQIYIIGFVNDLDTNEGLIRKSARERAVNLMNKLASETGGRAFFSRSDSELRKIAATIVSELHPQYLIDYSSTSKPATANHSLKVEVADLPNHDRRIALTLKWNGKRWQRVAQ